MFRSLAGLCSCRAGTARRLLLPPLLVRLRRAGTARQLLLPPLLVRLRRAGTARRLLLLPLVRLRRAGTARQLLLLPLLVRNGGQCPPYEARRSECRDGYRAAPRSLPRRGKRRDCDHALLHVQSTLIYNRKFDARVP